MKKLFIFLSLVVITCMSFGQNSNVESLIKEGIQLHDSGEYKQAIKKYKKALSLDPSSSLIHYEIALSYLSNKDYKKAEEFSKKVIDLNNGSVLSAYITYGSALDMMGKSNKAIKAYEEGMKEYDNYLLYYNHSITCLNAGKVDKAYDSALKAINNNSAHASSHLVLSKIMEQQGERVKAMLPLYFFLLIEPNSARAEIEYGTLRNYIDHGVTQSSDKNINVAVPMNNDPGFGAAEMMISLSKASNNLEGNEAKTEWQLFTKNNDDLFNILGELKNENTGFWWDFYVSFFYGMAEEDLTEVYSYYISLSQGDEVSQWIENHDEQFEKFKTWMSK